MADITFNPVSGVPFSGPTLMKDCTGTGGPYAPLSLSIAGYVPLVSLTAVSAIGAGAVMDNQGVRNNHSLVVVTSGTVNGGTVQLQGSQDGVNYVNLLASAIAPLSATATVWASTAQLTPVRFLRANVITTITGGGTITATVASAG